MAAIKQILSKRVQSNTELVEIIISFRHGKYPNGYHFRAKSHIFVTPDNFRNGEIAPNRRKVGNDVAYHEEQARRMRELCDFLYKEFAEANKKELQEKDWLRKAVERWRHPEGGTATHQGEDLTALMETYLQEKKFSVVRERQFLVLLRALLRYQGFIRATDKARAGFTFDVDTVTTEDIKDFFDYFRNEFELSKQYPKIFERLRMQTGTAQPIKQRGGNTQSGTANRLRAFFHWLKETGRTENTPFDGIKIKGEQYGTPYYITLEERNQIAEADLRPAYEATPAVERHGWPPLRTLEVQRDIFIFQCFCACRIGDLMRLTMGNITGNRLIYTPHKTQGQKDPIQARVPLAPRAMALIEKYHGVDAHGRLFPFISGQCYNDAIKVIFRLVGITRDVEVRNPLTGERELRPINEVASSHLARRTFIGNVYAVTPDPNIIGKMSGHKEGSKAFARYRNVEDDLLDELVAKGIDK